MSVALSLIASSEKYPLNLGFSKRPRDLGVHKPFETSDEDQTPFGYFDKSISSNYSFSHLIWVQRSQSYDSPPPPHWLLSASGTECSPYVTHTCVHICIWIHIRTHTDKITEMGQHMARSLAGISDTCAGTCHRGNRVEIKSMKRLPGLPSSMSVNTLVFAIFLLEDAHATWSCTRISTLDTLNCRANTVHAVSTKMILFPGLFQSGEIHSSTKSPMFQNFIQFRTYW